MFEKRLDIQLQLKKKLKNQIGAHFGNEAGPYSLENGKKGYYQIMNLVSP